MSASITLDCGHTTTYQHSARNAFYDYTMGYSWHDWLIACPNGCGLRGMA